jgi:hypothetical protein
MRLASAAVLTGGLLFSRAARADEPEPTPILPSTASVTVAPQRQSVASPDQEIRPARGPRRDATLFGVGIAATAVGGVAVPTGLLLTLLGASDRPTIFWFSPTQKDEGLIAAGVITTLAGAVLLAVGIPMIVHNGKRLPAATSASLHASPGGLELSF